MTDEKPKLAWYWKPRVMTVVSVNTEIGCLVLEPRLLVFCWNIKFGIPSVVYLSDLKGFV